MTGGRTSTSLARHFLAQYAVSYGRPGIRLAPAALAALRGGRWPGNVRELDSAIARAVATVRPGEVIGADRFADVEPAPGAEPTLLSWTAAVEAFRRRYFADMLRATGGNRSEAARRAGLSRQALLYHLRHLGKLGSRAVKRQARGAPRRLRRRGGAGGSGRERKKVAGLGARQEEGGGWMRAFRTWPCAPDRIRL